MTPKIKNIIIFAGILAIFIFIYISFIKKPESESDTNLVSSPNLDPLSSSIPGMTTSDQKPVIAQNFLSLLLNVKNIKLDDTIFADSAFNALRDTSISLEPDGSEGRPNPFAPIGTDKVEIPVATPLTPTTPTTPIIPPSGAQLR